MNAASGSLVAPPGMAHVVRPSEPTPTILAVADGRSRLGMYKDAAAAETPSNDQQ